MVYISGVSTPALFHERSYVMAKGRKKSKSRAKSGQKPQQEAW
jgi:hypothetical protein